MGVDIDEAGGHDRTVSVDAPERPFCDASDLDDAAIGDPDVRPVLGGPTSVDDRPALHDEVKHGAPFYPRFGRPPAAAR